MDLKELFKKKDAPKETDQEKRQRKRDETTVRLVDFTYDKEMDCYIWNETTKMKMKDVPWRAVHITGKKRSYFNTDIWDELIWPKEGQSAIHMFLWMINNKMNPDSITEKKKVGADIDMKKLIMYGAIAVVAIIFAWQFIPKG